VASLATVVATLGDERSLMTLKIWEEMKTQSPRRVVEPTNSLFWIRRRHFLDFHRVPRLKLTRSPRSQARVTRDIKITIIMEEMLVKILMM
jgi:hypothetical protein